MTSRTCGALGVNALGITMLSLLLTGCQQPETPDASSTSPVAAKPADRWLGRWEGVEGTYLEITKTDDRYAIEIKDLDKTNVYQGMAFSDGIAFTRDGKTETIHAGHGEQTGMKWLTTKKNCVVIRYGEGYCRD
jgi:hypothetical protein